MSDPERKRSYKVGRRNDKNIPKQEHGKLSKNRWAWCRVFFGQFVIWADYYTDHPDEVKDIKIVYPIPNRAPVTWNLTACTEDELDAIEELLMTAINLARPICKERDQEAKDAFEQGDDTFSRIYRTAPQLVYREGPFREHGEGVQHGPEDAAEVPRVHGDSGDDLRDLCSDVAEQDQADVSSQDNGPSPDKPEKLR